MSFEYANNRPMLMDPKYPASVKTWDCGGNDAGIVRIMEGQTGDGPCEAGHPPQGCTESQKAFSQDKKFNMRNEDLRPDEPEGDKHYEDF